MNDNIMKIIGRSLIGLLIFGVCFWCYQYYNLKKEDKEAILITDKVGMTIKVTYLHEDKLNSVDAINVYTQEIFNDVPISKNCPQYKDFPLNTDVDVVQVSYLNSKTGEKWKDYDGLYQRVCWGKSIHKFDKEKSEEKSTADQIISPDVIPEKDN